MGSIADTRASDFHFFLKTAGQSFTSISIFNSEFTCLDIRTPYANNSVGLMQGLKTLKNFFSWDGTQVVVHNDPLLGCSQSNRIQFLFSSEGFHFCIEESFNLPWDFSKKVIKIPPIPIIENSRINSVLLDTLTSQSDCPSGLRDFFQTTLKKIEKFQSNFKNTLRANSEFSNKDVHKDYLSLSGSSALKTIKSKPYASSQVEYEFDSAAVLRLKIITSELGVRVDFQGTTANPTLQLPDYVTDSICFQFFADYFQFGDLMNESTYSNFQIAKPTQSFVNSKVFTNKIYSDLCGPDLINQALIDGLAERLPAKSYLAMKPYFQILNSDNQKEILEFSFSNAKSLGTLALSYQFEPLLSSRPAPGGETIPSLKTFDSFGLEVTACQNVFRTPKAKDINDFQTFFQMTCSKTLKMNIVNPPFPNRTKTAKNKSVIVKPTASVNGEIKTAPNIAQSLAPGDRFEFKSGAIDFS